MNRRMRKKKRVVQCKFFNKMSKRTCDHFRHTSLAIRTKDGIVFGNKNGMILDVVHLLFIKEGIDPYLTKRIGKALKNATFDINFMKAPQLVGSDLVYDKKHVENTKLYFNTHGKPFESTMKLIGYTDPFKSSFYVFEYLLNEVEIVPRNRYAEKVIEYLDMSIVCEGYGIEFCEKLPRDKVLELKDKLKKYLEDSDEKHGLNDEGDVNNGKSDMDV